ncbi:unnamed protein product, partial [Prorocentrum cordatum]
EARPSPQPTPRRAAGMEPPAPRRAAAAQASAPASWRALVEGCEDSTLLLDPMRAGCPIVGVSARFASLTGRGAEGLIGRGLDSLWAGAPMMLVSRSTKQSFEDFCQECRRPDLTHAAEACGVQPCVREDGSVFFVFLALGLCASQPEPAEEGPFRRHVLAAALRLEAASALAPGAVHGGRHATVQGSLCAAIQRQGSSRDPACAGALMAASLKKTTVQHHGLGNSAG